MVIVHRSLVRWAFARFYREFAWTYDAVAAAVSGGRWFVWGRASLRYTHGAVLELGCGTGHLQRELARFPGVGSSVGLDASPQMLTIARRRLTRAARPIGLLRALAQTLPFGNHSFDTVVATFPTDYILDPAALADIRRVLRPGGRLVVVLAASFSRTGLYSGLIDLLYRMTLQRSPAAPPEPVSRSALGRRLAALGFAVDERWEAVGANYVQIVVAERV